VLVPAAVGALAPYLTLWLSRSDRARRAARRAADAGWHARVGAAGAALLLLAVGASAGRPGLPAWVPGVAALGPAAYAHVGTLVAADEIRRYPSERALHFDLDRPGTWPATAWLILATWTWLCRTRHPLVGPAYLSGVLAPVALPPAPAVAVAAYSLVMAVSCAPVPLPGHARAAATLGPRLA
jgi:hypothetical protein